MKISFHARAYLYVVSILPKYSVSQAVGCIKGKSAIHMDREYFGHKKNFTSQNLGPEDIMCLQQAKTKRQSANISRSKKDKIEESIN